MKIVVVGGTGTIGSAAVARTYVESVEGEATGEVLDARDFA